MAIAPKRLRSPGCRRRPNRIAIPEPLPSHSDPGWELWKLPTSQHILRPTLNLPTPHGPTPLVRATAKQSAESERSGRLSTCPVGEGHEGGAPSSKAESTVGAERQSRSKGRRPRAPLLEPTGPRRGPLPIKRKPLKRPARLWICGGGRRAGRHKGRRPRSPASPSLAGDP